MLLFLKMQRIDINILTYLSFLSKISNFDAIFCILFGDFSGSLPDLIVLILVIPWNITEWSFPQNVTTLLLSLLTHFVFDLAQVNLFFFRFLILIVLFISYCIMKIFTKMKIFLAELMNQFHNMIHDLECFIQ